LVKKSGIVDGDEVNLIQEVKQHFGWSYDHLVALLARGKATVMRWEKAPSSIDPFDADMLRALLTVPADQAIRIGKRVRTVELKTVSAIITSTTEISADAAFIAGVMFAGLTVEEYATGTVKALQDGVRHFQKLRKIGQNSVD
jgi:hypothetical protein